jgi:hypothetical protein
MNLYEITFIGIGQTVGWFTYDIRADNVFDAACELFNCDKNIAISSIVLVN